MDAEQQAGIERVVEQTVAWASRKGWDRDEARQVAWVAALEAACRFDGRGSLSGWLVARCRGAVIDAHRNWHKWSRKRHAAPWHVSFEHLAELETAEWAHDCLPATDDTEATAVARCEIAAVRLSDRERRIVQWTADGLFLAEMGAKLGLSTEAVCIARRKVVRRVSSPT